jgi:5S rRNA maturation endonuclease (ribonuclease M5)
MDSAKGTDMALTFHDIESVRPVITILRDLGIQKIRDNGEFFMFSSPFRSDEIPSMALYKSSLIVYDFGTRYTARIETFVRDVSGLDLYRDILNMKPSQRIDLQYQSMMRKKPEDTKPTKGEHELTISGRFYSITSLTGLVREQVDGYCRKRHIEDEFIQNFHVQYSAMSWVNGTPFRDRLIIPIVEDSKTISIEGRDVSGKQTPKVVYPKDSSVNTLFGIDHLDPTKMLIVVEGVMDLVQIWTCITKNVTATFGSKVTKRQHELLDQFDSLVVIPDDDQGGREFFRSICEHRGYPVPSCFVPEKDPGESSLEELKTAIDGALLSAHDQYGWK